MTKHVARIAILSLVCATLAYLATFLLKPRYEANEALTFAAGSSTAGSLSQLLPGKAPANAEGGVPLLNGSIVDPLIGANADAALGITHTRACLRYVIDQNGLLDAYGEHHLSKAMGILQGRMNTAVDKQGFLTITATDESPDRAIAIANSVERYLGLTVNRLSEQISHPNRLFVQHLYNQASHEVDRLRAETAKQVSARPLAQEISERSKAIWTVRTASDEARIKATGALAQVSTAQESLTRLMNQGSTFPGELIAIGAIGKGLDDLVKQLSTERIAMEQAARTFTAQSAEAKKARTDFEAANKVARNLLAQEMAGLHNNTDPSLVQAQATARALNREADLYEATLQKMLKEFSGDAGTYVSQELNQQEFKLAEARKAKLRDELDSAKIAEDRNTLRYSIVDEAFVSDEKVYPKRGLAFGVVFALATILQLVPALFKPAKTAA